MRVLLIFGITFLASSWAMSIPENPEALRTVSHGMNQFAKEFYKKSVENVNDNFVVSPIGISMVFSMVSFGAAGNTKTQMRTGLQMPADDSMMKSGIKSLMDQSKDISSVELKMANKVFTNTGLTMKPDFKEVTEKTFGSVAQTVDFSKAEEASQIINNWAAEQTNNKIQNLLKPDAVQDASMVLANAVYFKGKWAKPFKAEKTMPKAFHVDEKTTKDVPMMSKTDRLRYGELPSMKAKFVEIPYKREEGSRGKHVSMIIVVPNEINGLKDMEKDIDTLSMDMIRKNGGMREVELEMPKFKAESETDVKKVMKEMGMTDMFSDKADFSGITDAPPLKISKALQKAVIEVNEEGSEAAAVTTVIMVPMSMPMPPPEPIKMTIDRPFYYSIVMMNDDVEGDQVRSILFHGRVVNPTY